ncbi:MAG: hypothetical protein A2494_01815 [Candidatus Lloydbacteria bacterium RIFOXYC12_FULL_46_25]|uniref:Uncharacterized protein n=1 Tax=Candidatus Lloydbacteria bacterium RIFOXYC12_FULL_46_25 TaxID=1798670 RepID=A0A1G2DY66_9BACT|nr:MAG: hypothetical protein A2494_01815 [Candidatus Lloydbacteria bacterium RIFOXYC12_FULL_46_25]
MGVSKSDLRAINMGDGRIHKMHLLFPAVAVHSDADEYADDRDEKFEPDYVPSAEDVLIAISDGDEDFLSAHGLLYMLDADSDADDIHPVCDDGAHCDDENRFDNVVFLGRDDPLDEGPEDSCGALFDEPCCHLDKCETHKRLHSKVVYGPEGERITKYALVESHGVHGRKPNRPKRVTVRGATVRADIMYGPYGPRYVGFIAEVRKQG